jgi:hypothetical protein
MAGPRQKKDLGAVTKDISPFAADGAGAPVLVVLAEAVEQGDDDVVRNDNVGWLLQQSDEEDAVTASATTSEGDTKSGSDEPPSLMSSYSSDSSLPSGQRSVRVTASTGSDHDMVGSANNPS